MGVVSFLDKILDNITKVFYSMVPVMVELEDFVVVVLRW